MELSTNQRRAERLISSKTKNKDADKSKKVTKIQKIGVDGKLYTESVPDQVSTKSQISKLEVVWCRLLRRMVNRGFKRREDYSMVFTNSDIYRITGAESIENYLRKQQLRWVGHVCRMCNSSFQKRLLFSDTAKFKTDLWIKLEKISNLDRSQLRRLMMDRPNFSSWLKSYFC